MTGELKIGPGSARDLEPGRTGFFVTAEDDKTVPPDRAEETAEAMGVPVVFLGRDWGLPGHGHMFVSERETGEIAARAEVWLARHSTR
ncbi:hypothetical protein [Pigmentiphaga humi]|uniref:hypothetical protein n=1 Tax=Pigmentiphaga humi TaxID=2478468 RepID=UPI000F542315|nr:hypothetical protein [Pigmentiphaga humi]